MKTNGRQDISGDKHFSVILQLAINTLMQNEHAIKYCQGYSLNTRIDFILTDLLSSSFGSSLQESDNESKVMQNS